MIISPFGHVAWLHQLDPQRDVIATLISLPAASFSVDGASVASDAAKVIAGLKLDITPSRMAVSFYDGDYSASESYAGTSGIGRLGQAT